MKINKIQISHGTPESPELSDNRTYHFQAEDENEQRAWTSVLVNCKEGALMRAFHQQAGESNDNGHSLLDLQRSIIRAVRSLPGNQVCADCGSTNGKFFFFVP